jgi:hypothetical protein
MGKKCVEEFNPWPPFVDIFASVILVMLLFMLILLVNLGYYAQFNAKTTFTGSIETDEILNSDTPTKITTDFTAKAVPTPPKDNPEKPKEETKPELKSIFDGTNAISYGNAVSRDKSEDKSYSEQKVDEKDREFLITYQDKEMFLKENIATQLKSFITTYKNRYGSMKLYITASDPRHIASKTVSKQISLGRVLHIQNLFKRFGMDRKKVNINLRKKETMSLPFGLVRIRIDK